MSPLLTCLLLGACTATQPAIAPGEPEPARARAALSVVYVENHTTLRLTIAYRLAGTSAAEVIVGSVAPDSLARLAPLPAGEPVILSARTPDGRQHVLEPRSFGIDTEWTWRIDSSVRFTAAPQGSE